MHRFVAVSVMTGILTLFPGSPAGARTYVNPDNGWCRELQASWGTGVEWDAQGHRSDHNGDGIVCHSFLKNGKVLTLDNLRH